MGFHLPNFGLSRPFRSRVMSRHATDRDGQTDGRTDNRGQFIMPPPLRGRGHKKPVIPESYRFINKKIPVSDGWHDMRSSLQFKITFIRCDVLILTFDRLTSKAYRWYVRLTYSLWWNPCDCLDLWLFTQYNVWPSSVDLMHVVPELYGTWWPWTLIYWHQNGMASYTCYKKHVYQIWIFCALLLLI